MYVYVCVKNVIKPSEFLFHSVLLYFFISFLRNNIKSKLGFEDGDDEDVSSDDSYLEHDSPFVKHTKSNMQYIIR